MDKILAFLVIFIAMFALFASIMASNAIPNLFKHLHITDITKETIEYQTGMFMNYMDRQNNVTKKILENQNASLATQNELLEEAVITHNQLVNITKQNNDILKEILNYIKGINNG